MLLKPHVHFSGTQLAGWTPKETSPREYGIVFEHDVEIRLPDGTILRGDLYRPKSEGRFPALVAWSCYTKELQSSGVPLPINEVGVVSHIVSRGYCHITINARGSGRSGGTRAFQFSEQEQRDVADGIDWVGVQPWCDGNVGMVGMSYFAAIQYLAAAQHPKHLKAIFPYLGFTDFYRHFAYHGGAVQSDFFSFYYSLVGSSQKLKVPPRVRHALGYVIGHNWFQKLATKVFLPLRPRMAKKLHPEESWVRDFVKLVFDERYDGEFYRERSASSILDKIDVPVCIGTNWGNAGLHMRGAFEAWDGLRSEKRLFVGPPDNIWPWEAYQEELLAWYDHHLRGIDNGVDQLPPVRYWLQGADRWEQAQDWPIPGAKRTRLHLADAEPGLRDQTHMPGQEASMSFLAIPRGMLYPKELEKYEPQVLSFASPAFADDTKVVGPVQLRLTLASTALDTHIIARLSDLSPDGSRRTLSLGWLQAAFRNTATETPPSGEIVHDYTTPHALTPSVPVEMTISLTPFANLFRSGHKLLLEIGSRPDMLEATYSEGFVYIPYDAPPYPARNTIDVGGEGSSYLDIEILE